MELRIERLCVERGLKMTGQRRVIARVLSEASDHPDVEELYRRASALDARISIATVYRTVRLLEEKGILERRDFGGGRARYETERARPPSHLIDIETGKVIEFQDPEYEQLMQTMAERLGFDLVSLRLELFGRRRGPAQGGQAEGHGGKRADASWIAVAQSCRRSEVARSDGSRRGGAMRMRDDRCIAGARLQTRPAIPGDCGAAILGVRIATSAAEIDAVQALRYRVFYDEMGASRRSRHLALTP